MLFQHTSQPVDVLRRLFLQHFDQVVVGDDTQQMSFAVHDGLVYAPDLTGYLHCVDFETGQRYWEYDTLAAIWGSPMVVDGKVLLGDEDGDLIALDAGKEQKLIAEKIFPSSIYSTPTIANGVIFVSDRSRLYAFKATE